MIKLLILLFINLVNASTTHNMVFYISPRVIESPLSQEKKVLTIDFSHTAQLSNINKIANDQQLMQSVLAHFKALELRRNMQVSEKKDTVQSAPLVVSNPQVSEAAVSSSEPISNKNITFDLFCEQYNQHLLLWKLQLYAKNMEGYISYELFAFLHPQYDYSIYSFCFFILAIIAGILIPIFAANNSSANNMNPNIAYNQSLGVY